MIRAIMMVSCEKGKVHQVAETLADIDGVAEVYSISGDWDVLAVLKVPNYDELSSLVTQTIASVDGIARTNTHMAFRAYSKSSMERAWAETMAE